MLNLEYIEIDGLLYPNIETGMENIETDLSKYCILRLRYLHEHMREMYRELLLAGKLAEHCKAIDKPLLNAQNEYKQIGSKPIPYPLRKRWNVSDY